jgi:hypothetical protein
LKLQNELPNKTPFTGKLICKLLADHKIFEETDTVNLNNRNHFFPNKQAINVQRILMNPEYQF